jgi:hypothetical protein
VYSDLTPRSCRDVAPLVGAYGQDDYERERSQPFRDRHHRASAAVLRWSAKNLSEARNLAEVLGRPKPEGNPPMPTTMRRTPDMTGVTEGFFRGGPPSCADPSVDSDMHLHRRVSCSPILPWPIFEGAQGGVHSYG